MTVGARFSRLGFDPAQLRFAVRTALAACLALLVAWLLRLEHPQWAAMTVWAASQPVRGMLLEKSFFRAAGTAVGVVAGVALMLVSAGQPALLVAGLALWIGLCVGAGNVLRGFISYGTILAGYSASMVALLSTAHPDRVLLLGVDRFLTVFTGVAVAMLVGLLFTPKAAEEEIVGRMRRLTARLLRLMASQLRDRREDLRSVQRAILSEMAGIDEGLDPHGAGSLRSRRSIRQLRAILVVQVQALLWLRHSDGGERDPVIDEAIGEALTRAAGAIEAAAKLEVTIGALEQAVGLSAGQPGLQTVLAELEAALRDRLPDRAAERMAAPLVILHRDWVGARHAMIRATGTLLLLGAAWVLSGWSAGPFLLLGTSVMISLFSTFDNPAGIMRYVFWGQVFGAVAALACRWLVWPLATNELGLILLLWPFILLGALPLAHRRTMSGGYDYNLILLLLLQPVFPLAGTFENSLAMALAVVAAPLVALVAFRYAFPADARRRRDMLLAMMVHEVERMAGAADVAAHAPVWRARLRYRLLRLVRWVEKSGEHGVAADDGSLAVMQIGDAILYMRGILQAPGLGAGTARAVDMALSRLRDLGLAPERAARALERAALRLARERPAEGEIVGDAGRALAANLGFFRRAEPASTGRRGWRGSGGRIARVSGGRPTAR